jgi:hypothetical protein
MLYCERFKFLERGEKMKPTKQITYCECCDTAIDLVSPPNADYYENGQIKITNGVMLLPKEVDSSHSAEISGIYCDIHCLIKHLRMLLKKGLQ